MGGNEFTMNVRLLKAVHKEHWSFALADAFNVKLSKIHKAA